MPASSPDAQDIFQALAQQYGITTALQLLSLLNPSASGAQQVLGAAKLAGTGANVAGSLAGAPALAEIGQGIGELAGLAGTGYDIFQNLSNPKLSTGQKIGSTTFDVASLAGGPGMALLQAAIAGGGALEKSGSPQIRAGGRQILAPLLPVIGLESVLTGKQSPRAAFNSMIESIKEVPIIGGPAGDVLSFFGLGTKPTEGTIFRNELGNIFKQIPELKGTPTSPYNIDPAYYNSIPADIQARAHQLADELTSYTPDAPKLGKATGGYDSPAANQAVAILLNKFGTNLPQLDIPMNPKGVGTAVHA